MEPSERHDVSFIAFYQSLADSNRWQCREVPFIDFPCMRADFGKRWTHVSRASAAGWPGSRTYRRAYRPPNGLSRISQGSLESLYGATFNPPLRCFSPLISHGAAVQLSALHRVL